MRESTLPPGGLGREGTQVLRATPEVGTRVADRYRLDERVWEQEGISLWNATDEMLARPVGIYLIPEDHELADEVLRAARAAATVEDSRFVRLLDAVRRDGAVHIVQERWPRARPLSAVLAEDGPLDPRDAQVMITELAEAIAAAHAVGLPHLRLQPDTVLMGPSGQVKVFGLGIEAALNSTSATDPVRADVRALARVLHAALTARWPEGEAFGLLAAPYENGAICTPRQVRAGVPDVLDSVVDRVLNARPRSGTPLRNPAELVEVLRQLPAPRQTAVASPRGTATRAPLAPAVPPPARGWRPSPAARSVQIGVVTVLILGLALLGWQIARALGPGGTGNAGPTTGPLQAIRVVDVIVFDPVAGAQPENVDQAPLAVGSRSGTGWQTNRYRTANFGHLKPGVGLILDLGRPQTVRQVRLTFPNEGSSVEVRAANASGASPPLDLESYLTAARADDASGQETLRFAFATRTRFLLIWLTKLPKDPGGGYRGGLSEIAVSG